MVLYFKVLGGKNIEPKQIPHFIPHFLLWGELPKTVICYFIHFLSNKKISYKLLHCIFKIILVLLEKYNNSNLKIIKKSLIIRIK